MGPSRCLLGVTCEGWGSQRGMEPTAPPFVTCITDPPPPSTPPPTLTFPEEEEEEEEEERRQFTRTVPGSQKR